MPMWSLVTAPLSRWRYNVGSFKIVCPNMCNLSCSLASLLILVVLCSWLYWILSSKFYQLLCFILSYAFWKQIIIVTIIGCYCGRRNVNNLVSVRFNFYLTCYIFAALDHRFVIQFFISSAQTKIVETKIILKMLKREKIEGPNPPTTLLLRIKHSLIFRNFKIY